MSSIALESERVRLEPFAERHLTERYVSWLADPEVVRYSENRFRAHTLESCRAYVESFRGTPNLLYALVAKDPSLGHFGNLNVYVDERHQTADVGILVGERGAWGKGYGGEAWAAMLRHLVEQRRIRKVTGGCAADNLAMVRIMQRCGMIEDGRRARHYLYDGKEVDVVYFAVFSAAGDRS